MNDKVLDTFRSARLACPICGGALELKGASLVCPGGHCYDVAAKGYVNFAGDAGTKYGLALFEHRRRVFEAGIYREAAEWLRANARGAALDAGCGEGYFTACLGPDAYGLDLSREAIRLASRRPGVRWLAADLARMPIQSGALDTVANVLSPASYSEFRRVLKPGGRVLKIAPGARYLRELREIAGMPGYDEGLPARRMAERMRVTREERLTVTRPVTPGLAADLLAMTPLTFGADLSAIDPARLTEITIDLLLLTGE